MSPISYFISLIYAREPLIDGRFQDHEPFYGILAEALYHRDF